MTFSDENGTEFAGFVYRVLGPDGIEYRWIARSVSGQVAHGKTPESAVENLRAGMELLAELNGQSFADWRRSQAADGSRFVKASELVQA